MEFQFPAGALPCSLGQLNSAFHHFSGGKSSTSLLADVKAGCVHLCRVAGNTVSSHMAGGACDGIRLMKSYMLRFNPQN